MCVPEWVYVHHMGGCLRRPEKDIRWFEPQLGSVRKVGTLDHLTMAESLAPGHPPHPDPQDFRTIPFWSPRSPAGNTPKIYSSITLHSGVPSLACLHSTPLPPACLVCISDMMSRIMLLKIHVLNFRNEIIFSQLLKFSTYREANLGSPHTLRVLASSIKEFMKDTACQQAKFLSISSKKPHELHAG